MAKYLGTWVRNTLKIQFIIPYTLRSIFFLNKHNFKEDSISLGFDCLRLLTTFDTTSFKSPDLPIADLPKKKEIASSSTTLRSTHLKEKLNWSNLTR